MRQEGGQVQLACGAVVPHPTQQRAQHRLLIRHVHVVGRQKLLDLTGGQQQELLVPNHFQEMLLRNRGGAVTELGPGEGGQGSTTAHKAGQKSKAPNRASFHSRSMQSVLSTETTAREGVVYPVF